MANPAHVGGFPKPRPRVLDKMAEKVIANRKWKDARAFVLRRDGGKCRACKKPGFHLHHVIYRSHGGHDDRANLILVCEACHRLIHAKVLLVTFNKKRPADTVRFTRNTQWDHPSAGEDRP